MCRKWRPTPVSRLCHYSWVGLQCNCSVCSVYDSNLPSPRDTHTHTDARRTATRLLGQITSFAFCTQRTRALVMHRLNRFSIETRGEQDVWPTGRVTCAHRLWCKYRRWFSATVWLSGCSCIGHNQGFAHGRNPLCLTLPDNSPRKRTGTMEPSHGNTA